MADSNSIMSSPWSNAFFYQLYSMLYMIGTIPEEVSSSLQQLLIVLEAMHAKDQTLEFKNALTPEKLFLNRYPELEQAFHPIAMGLLETMNDALSVNYIFEHYFDDIDIVTTIIKRNAILTLIQDKSSRTKYAKTLVVPTVKCLNTFHHEDEIAPYFATVLAIICSDNCSSFAYFLILGEMIGEALVEQDLMLTVISLVRQFSEPYLRNVSLFILSQLAKCIVFHFPNK